MKINFCLETSQIVYSLLVVDDGSTDKTPDIANENGVIVIRHTRNMGKGEALKSGFQYAISNKYLLIATIDADLQHDPVSLPAMLSHFTTGEYDIVIGARSFRREKMSLSRVLSNKITSWLISIRIGQPIIDSQSGYRIIRTAAIKNLFLRTSRFETESEILIRLAKQHGRFGFFPIDTIYAGEKSNIRHFQDTLRFIKMYLSTFIY